jgi:predicted DNA binding protein
MLEKQALIEDEPIHVVLEVPDHETLRELMETVSNADVAVETKEITSARPRLSTVEVDLDMLTDKQREALVLAFDSGYYDRPRKASLADIAEQLGISKSAVSQRLRNAEMKLVESVFGTYR